MKKYLIATALISLLAAGGASAMESTALKQSQETLSKNHDVAEMSMEDRLTSLEDQIAELKMLIQESMEDDAK
ncbi:hypothetical protein [Halomonas binhaiensis]|uniref:Porin n=1 Tax=Halomonas binhaiensis TaxID=2562282 RepID=A0A5C1NHN0_9GAMM|nr:hypothetical protein [Halomonas binhaiensis]QEM81209.1 hypothetical protein E4T21_06420 [Halomonas binhaiensis]